MPLTRFSRGISIHALLAESDVDYYAVRHFPVDISIHALLAESDMSAVFLLLAAGAFLSTLSLRRATYLGEGKSCNVRDFYPRSPCGERLPSGSKYSGCSAHFYPRSPCGERPPKVFRHCTTYLFLSTLSLRRATRNQHQRKQKDDFYPRSPCGERPLTPARMSSRLLISIHALLAESDVLQS